MTRSVCYCILQFINITITIFFIGNDLIVILYKIDFDNKKQQKEASHGKIETK